MSASLETLTLPAPRPAPDLPSPAMLAQFADRNPASYQSHYERLLRRRFGTDPAHARTRLPVAPSWSWPAFLLTVPWLFYRKMYSGAIILVALPVFLDHVLPGSLFLGSGLAIALTTGIFGKSWYVEHAVRRFAKAGRIHQDRAMRKAYLARAKGVSLSAGAFGLLIQIVTAIVVVMDLLPPNRF